MPLCLLLLVLFSANVFAHNLVSGERVAPVGVADRGELTLRNDDVVWQPWNSARLTGQPTVILHMAGRLSAKEQNADTLNAIAAARLPVGKFQLMTIVNTDDAIPGSGLFVRRSLIASKRETPAARFIVDERGEVRRAWQLTAGGAAIIVLDKQGRVLFAKDGTLTQAETRQVIRLLTQMLA